MSAWGVWPLLLFILAAVTSCICSSERKCPVCVQAMRKINLKLDVWISPSLSSIVLSYVIGYKKKPIPFFALWDQNLVHLFKCNILSAVFSSHAQQEPSGFWSSIASFCFTRICFFLVLRLLRNHYKKKDPKRQVHYLQFNSSWSLENCHGLHRGGEIVYRVQWFLTRASAEDHYQLTEWAVYDHAQECFVYHVQENGLHLPHVPDGITQFTLISSNLDVYLGN